MAARIAVDRATGRTSNPKYYAGGDCVNGGREVVDAVADGKRAALGIAAMAGGDPWLTSPPTSPGIRCPNPFWLASGPPTNCGEQVMRAFDAGWGGAVWKTIGEPIVNVSSRYSSVDWNGQRMMGLNNIELISDRPIEVNLREIAEVKKRYPKHAVIASLMVESKREAWHDIVKRAEDAGADGLELNFGCPHGMSERGMGCAVGQVPEYACMITEWVKEVARTPVLVKLTPNITDIRTVARAAKRGGADALSAINTINSITGIDLDTFAPRPNVGGRSVARRLLRSGGEADRAPPGAADRGRPGGRPAHLRHRRHFRLARGGGVHPARLRHGAGLHRRHALRLPHRRRHDRRPQQLDGRERLPHASKISAASAVPKVTEWKHLDLNYKIVARIDRDTCIGCDLCYIACWDGAHQCIHLDRPRDARGHRSASRACIAITPIAKLDTRSHQRPPRRPRAFRASMKRNASAAISAGWSARWRTASRWSGSIPACRAQIVGAAHASARMRMNTLIQQRHRRHRRRTPSRPTS